MAEQITTPADLDAPPVRRIYVASSWRNLDQPEVVARLRARGFEVYDFRNPPGRAGFAWSEIDPWWQSWTAADYIAALQDPHAVAGYESDFAAMQWADTFVLVLPCGRSAHLELGWAVGAGKRTVIITRDGEEPELMAKMVDHIAVGLDDALEYLSRPDVPEPTSPAEDREALAMDVIRPILARGAYQMGEGELPYEAQARAVADAVVAARSSQPAPCPRCGGTGEHGMVHTRYGNGGGGNRPCPEAQPTPVAFEADTDRAVAWADYRKEYGASRAEHKAFRAGWDAAKGDLDVGGVQR